MTWSTTIKQEALQHFVLARLLHQMLRQRTSLGQLKTCLEMQVKPIHGADPYFLAKKLPYKNQWKWNTIPAAATRSELR